MTTAPVTLTVDVRTRPGAHLIAPLGLSTPHAAPLSVQVSGATHYMVSDPGAAQHALWLTPDGRQSRPDLEIAVEDLDDAPPSDVPNPDVRRQAPRPNAGAAQ